MSWLEHYRKFGAQPPEAVTKGHLVYEAIMGSRAYGCNKTTSDYDILGICVPPVGFIFNHLVGIFPGFGTNPYRFDHWEQQKLCDGDKKEASFSIYSIVRFFDLALGSNPNFVELVFAPQVNITHITQIGHKIRENRHLFLSKLAVHKMRAYAVSQLRKLENKNPIGNRKLTVDEFGFDVKFSYHLMRLLLQTEQILLEKDLTLDRNGKLLFAIRNGEWPKEKLIDICTQKEKDIEKLILTSDLQAKSDENKIKNLLLECIEIQYGKISDRIIIKDSATNALKQIQEICNKSLKESEACIPKMN